MIDIIFNYFNDTILVRVEGNKVLFGNTAYGNKMSTIDGLKLSQSGVLKEFPDLKDNLEWRKIAIQRFKEKIEKMKSENEVTDYVIADLSKYGYVPRYKQRQGHRPERIKWHG